MTVFPRVSMPGLTRVSLGLENTPEDVDALLAALTELVQRPRGAGGEAKELTAFADAATRRVYTPLPA